LDGNGEKLVQELVRTADLTVRETDDGCLSQQQVIRKQGVQARLFLQVKS